MPLTARVFTAGNTNTGSSAISVLSIDKSNLLLVMAKPVEKGIILHLRETSGQEVLLTTEDIQNERVLSMDEVTVLGDVIRKDIDIAKFKPYEVKFIKLNIGP